MRQFINKVFVALLPILPLTVTGCMNRDKHHQPLQAYTKAPLTETTILSAPDSSFSETKLEIERSIVLERAHDIFRVIKDYQLSMGGFVISELLDKSYCSKSWNKLLMSVRRKEYQTSTLFFEIDYWTMSRDPGLVSFDEFEVTRLDTSGKRKFATVNYTVYEALTYTPARIDMVYEDGHWVIDNFYDMKFMVDVRSSMLQYLATDMI